jgi:hypothetical protein
LSQVVVVVVATVPALAGERVVCWLLLLKLLALLIIL